MCINWLYMRFVHVGFLLRLLFNSHFIIRLAWANATLSVMQHAMPYHASQCTLHLRIVSFIHSFIHGLAGFTVFIVTFILKTEPNLVFCLASFSLSVFVLFILFLVFIVTYRRTLKNVSKHLTLLCVLYTYMCLNNFHLFTVILHWNHTHKYIVLGEWLWIWSMLCARPRKPYSYQNHLTEWIVVEPKKLFPSVHVLSISSSFFARIHMFGRRCFHHSKVIQLQTFVNVLEINGFVVGFCFRSFWCSVFHFVVVFFCSLIFRYVFEHSSTDPFVLHII